MTHDLPMVLVVDDEVRSQDAIRRTLDEDFAVLTASNADEARDAARAARGRRRWTPRRASRST